MNTFTDEIPKFLPIGRTGNILFLENLTNPDIEKISDEVFFENQIPQWKKKDITGVYFFRSGSEKIMSGFPDHEKEIIFYDLSINEIDSEVYNEILRRHKNIIILFNEAVRGEVLLFCAKLFSLLDPLSDPEKIVGIIFGKELETETLALKKFAASNKRSILNNHFSANKIQRHPGMEKSATVPASLENKKTESTITPETNKDIGIPAVKLSEQSELKPEEQKASIEESKTKFGRRTSDRNSPEHPLFGDGAASKQESQIEQKAEDLPADTTTLGSDSPKWSLQIKMMGVISSIFALTLTVIISLATYFFKTDNEVRIMENGLSLVNILGAKVQTDIAALVDKGRQLAVTLNQNFESKERRNFFINLFFENDPNFIMLGVYKKESDHLVELSKVFNDRHLHDSKISGADLDELIKKHEAAFLKTFNGKPVIYNASPGAKEKIFAMGIPAASSGNTNAILIMLVKLEKIQSAFEKSGEFETFLVNREGLVIAHKDEKVTLAGADFSDLPIVKNMQASAANNGQIKYKDAAGKNYLGSFKKMGFGDGGIIATVSEDKAFEAVYNIQQRNIYIMVIALSLSLIIVFFFAKSISKPVLKLLSATLKISKGDFKVDIESTTKDEVGVLTNYFIKMGQGLEEREKVKSILGSMIDPTVVKEAMIDMAALKRGSEKKITAFFSDVAGFSTISEQLTSIELAALLNEYLGSMTIILKKYDGVLDKYIGDAIVGIFNAPVDIAEPALSAARASLEMIDKLTELRKYWTENDLYSKDSHVMDVRIGLNTGVAKVGFMGTDALASYTMMGDTVNLAARLEAAGKDYGVNILISQMTKEEVEGEMFTRELDVVRVKGKNEPVKIFELISTKSNVDPKVAEATELYNRGFQLYLSQNWTDAIDKFQKSQKVKGTKDKACSMLIHRCEDYKLDPPGKDWDGVFTRTHK